MRESMHEEPTHEEPMLLLNGILGINRIARVQTKSDRGYELTSLKLSNSYNTLREAVLTAICLSREENVR